MNGDMQRLVRRLDILFLAGLLMTSALAAILFWTEFYDDGEDAVTELPSVLQTGMLPTGTGIPAESASPEGVTAEATALAQDEVATETPVVVAVVPTGTATPIPTEVIAVATEPVEASATPEPAPDTGATATTIAIPHRSPVATTEQAPPPQVVTGTAEPGDQVELYVQGSLIAAATADAEGFWSATLPNGADVDPVELEIVVIVPGELTGQGGPFEFDLTMTPVASETPHVTLPPTATFTPWPVPTGTPSVTPFAMAEALPETAEVSDVFMTTPTGEAFPVTPTLGAESTAVAFAPEAAQAEAAMAQPETVIMSGIAEPGTTVIITSDGEPVGETTADTNGTWSFTWERDGAGEPQVEVQSAASGETGPQIEAQSVEGDAGPSPEVVAVMVVPAITVPVSGDIVVPGPITARGTGQAGATVRFENDTTGAVLGSGVVAVDGIWQIRAALAGEGEQALVAITVDEDGHVLRSDTVTVILAQPVHPQTGANHTGDGPAGRAYAALIALLLAAGGFTAYFAGRLLYTLGQDRLRAG